MAGERAVNSFLNNLSKMITFIISIQAIPILGGVYPHNFYQTKDYEMLKKTDQKMKDPSLGWKNPKLEYVFDFLR